MPRSACLYSLVCLPTLCAPVLALPSLKPIEPTVPAIRAVPVFSEPLIPVLGVPGSEENRALAKALDAVRANGKTEPYAPLEEFTRTFPKSSWVPSLLANLGVTYRKSGYYSRALEAWEQAWTLSKAATKPEEQAVADLAVGNLAELWARLGRRESLETLLQDLQNRSVRGPGSSRVEQAKLSLAFMNEHPDRGYRCGPVALGNVLAALKLGGGTLPKIEAYPSTHQGTSLAQMQALAKEVGVDMIPRKRQAGAEPVVPAVLHWRAGHFAALVEKKGEAYLLLDPTFGHELWVSRAAIEEEGSGYALIPASAGSPAGWDQVSEEEAKAVWGKGPTPGHDPSDVPYDDDNGNCRGMARYSMAKNLVSLRMKDIPVGYAPPRGERIDFLVSFNEGEPGLPQTFTFSNLGPGWTHRWMTFVSGLSGTRPEVFERTGGRTYAGEKYNPTRGILYPASSNGGVTERRYPDGSKEVFGYVVGDRSFLTQVVDPAGNTINLAYDGSNRLASITDPLGQATTLSYELASDPLKITKVTDPFGRFATFEYNAAGQLSSITDAVGMKSQFAYGPTSGSPTANSNFIHALTTPYGTTTFSTGNNGPDRWLEAKDPLGQRERMEFKNQTPIPSTETAPPDFTSLYLDYRNTFFWNKAAMAASPGDYSSAKIYHWLHRGDNAYASSILESVKPAGGCRIWYHYGQTMAPTYVEGPNSSPTEIVQYNPGGYGFYPNWETSRFRYTDFGRTAFQSVPGTMDTGYTYSDAGDLLTVLGPGDEKLAEYRDYVQHKPQTVIDQAGKTTLLTYNAFGQVTSITNPKLETTRLTYDARGYLTQVEGPLAGSTTTLAYDTVGRLLKVTDPEGAMTTFDYDGLDRQTRVGYSDGTFEQTGYDRLDVGQFRDRQGNWSLMSHNAVGQLESIQDSLGRTTRLGWCGCGSLESLTDPQGRTTLWIRDTDGHVLSKVYDDKTAVHYAYDTMNRVAQRTDAMGQVTTYTYRGGNQPYTVSYSNTQRPTPSVRYTYDSFARLSSMTDGIGTTSYGYNAPGSLGAGRVASVSGPTPNSSISYGYDELGRLTRRTVNGVAESRAFDPLGRLTTVANPLGISNYTYEGLTGRLSRVALPNGQTTQFTYTNGQNRLQSIQNVRSDGSNISTFSYGYDGNGQISTWSQQADAKTPKVYSFQYDAVGQLLNATLHDGSVAGQVLKTYGYSYDAGGNRTQEQIDGILTTSTHNGVNQLTGQQTSIVPPSATPTTAPASGSAAQAPTSRHPN